MPQSSLSSWWNSRLCRNDTKVLKNTSGKSSGNRDTRQVAVSIATAKVSSVAALSIFKIIEAQAGAPTSADMAICVAGLISKYVNRFYKIAARAARDVAAGGTEHRTQTGLPVVIDLGTVVTAVSRDVHVLDIGFRKDVGQIDKAKHKPHHIATCAAAANVFAEISYAFLDVIEAHVASVAMPTTMSVPPLEKLLFAVAAAATESARGVADAFKLMENRPPPPYEDREPKKILDSL